MNPELLGEPEVTQSVDTAVKQEAKVNDGIKKCCREQLSPSRAWRLVKAVSQLVNDLSAAVSRRRHILSGKQSV